MRKTSFLPIVLVMFFFLTPHDSLQLPPTQKAAARYQYGLAQWEVANFLSKWWHRAWNGVTNHSLSREEQQRKIEEFFQLGEGERRLLDEHQRLAAGDGTSTKAQLRQVGEGLTRVRENRDALQPFVEEFLEGELSSVLREQGILLQTGPFLLQFPPVDFSFDVPPKILIISPRDRIERLESFALLLKPGMTVTDMENLEEYILTSQNLSALVESTGGVATYPALVPTGHSLRTTLQIAAHEWLHHYLFFKPMGRQYGRDQTMLTLNETVANLAGRELGDLAYIHLVSTFPNSELAEGRLEEKLEVEYSDTFVFDQEMRKTRLRVDQLLARGRIEKAEEYMEHQRQFFAENGVYIRKLNQAYFAFNGSYGDSSASTSPVGKEIADLRATTPSVGAFVKAVAEVSNYEEFQALIQKHIRLSRDKVLP